MTNELLAEYIQQGGNDELIPIVANFFICKTAILNCKLAKLQNNIL